MRLRRRLNDEGEEGKMFVDGRVSGRCCSLQGRWSSHPTASRALGGWRLSSDWWISVRNAGLLVEMKDVLIVNLFAFNFECALAA